MTIFNGDIYSINIIGPLKYLKKLTLNESVVTKELVRELLNSHRLDSFGTYLKLIPITEPYEIALQKELLGSFEEGRDSWDNEYGEGEIDYNRDPIVISIVWETIWDNIIWKKQIGGVSISQEEAVAFQDAWIYDSNHTFIPNLSDEEYLEETIIRIDPNIEEIINTGSIKSAVDKGILVDYELLVPIILDFYPPMEKTYLSDPPDPIRMEKLTKAARLLANRRG